MTREIPVSFHDPAEQLPDDDTTVLIVDQEDCYCGWHDGDDWFDCTGMVVTGVLAWAYLPDPSEFLKDRYKVEEA